MSLKIRVENDSAATSSDYGAFAQYVPASGSFDAFDQPNSFFIMTCPEKKKSKPKQFKRRFVDSQRRELGWKRSVLKRIGRGRI